MFFVAMHPLIEPSSGATARSLVVTGSLTPDERASIRTMHGLETVVIEHEGTVEAEDLATLARLPLLRDLEVCAGAIPGNPAGFGSLTRLSLQASSIGHGWGHLVARNPLHTVVLRADTLEDPSDVGHALRACSTLRDLSLRYAEGRVLRGLAGISQLERITLESCAGSDGEVRALLFSNKGLRSMALRASRGLTNGALQYLSEHPDLEVFTLDECDMDAGVFNQLATLEKLKRVSIGVEMVASTLPQVIPRWPRIEEVDILGFVCPRGVAEALLALPLQSLAINGDLPTDALFEGGRTATSVALAYQEQRAITFGEGPVRLESLALRNARLTEREIAFLAQIQGMTTLRLSRCTLPADLTQLGTIPLQFLWLPRERRVDTEAIVRAWPFRVAWG